jgi:glycosyltransferase involved in cell wall biosynthesis
LNDVTYSPLISAAGWPAIYDVTDDWLLAPFSVSEVERLEALDAMAMKDAREVVVCSQQLERTRGQERKVTLIPNGVDRAHFTSPRVRPADLPRAPVAVYVGTLHESRLDVDLVRQLAADYPDLNVVLVGPIALGSASRRTLESAMNIAVLGSKPYDSVPAYLQHADVLIVPHVVTPFTDSLDPIKAYEYAAVSKPVVATPVAGFREHPRLFVIAPRETFPARVKAAIGSAVSGDRAETLPSWADRASAFEDVARRALAAER